MLKVRSVVPEPPKLLLTHVGEDMDELVEYWTDPGVKSLMESLPWIVVPTVAAMWLVPVDVQVMLEIGAGTVTVKDDVPLVGVETQRLVPPEPRHTRK
jgi:hypothetical protein